MTDTTVDVVKLLVEHEKKKLTEPTCRRCGKKGALVNAGDTGYGDDNIFVACQNTECKCFQSTQDMDYFNNMFHL